MCLLFLLCSLCFCSTRKFFTILCSVVLYGHSLSTIQWSGVTLVFAGLSVDIYTKYAQQKQKQQGKKQG